MARRVARRTTPPVRLLPQLAAVLVGAVLLHVMMTAVEPHLGPVIPGFDGWAANATRDPLSALAWLVGDTTEAEFHKTVLGGLGMLAAAAIAHVAARRRLRWRGFDISYGSGLWPWLLFSALVGLALSEIAWGWTLAGGSWQPTFVAFVSVPPAVVLVHGRGVRVALTGAVLGAALTTPVSLAVVNGFCNPLGLPGVIGNVTGMWVGALLAFWICRKLPWMPTPSGPDESAADECAADDGGAPEAEHPTARPLTSRRAWLPRRVLADFTEAQFYGNEWASVGLLVGTLATWLLNPAAPAYGSNLLPGMLTAQVLTGALACWLYAPQWQRHRWYPTYVPMVSVAPAAVLTFGGSWVVIVVAAVLGALAGPPLAHTISARLPDDFHPFIGNVISMTVCTLLIVPAIALLPGFSLPAGN